MQQENGLSPLEQVMPLCYKALGEKKGGGGGGVCGLDLNLKGLVYKKRN